MRLALLVFGCLCCLIGAEFLIVDKVVLHDFTLRHAATPAAGDGRPDAAPQLIDLPDSAGYVLVAVGVVALMYHLALGRRERPK